MRTKKILLNILIICFSLLNVKANAQEDYRLSVYYKYSIKLNIGKFKYPLGFGSTISRNISDNLIFTVGIEYAHLSDENQEQFTPAVYRLKYISKESIYSFSSGLSYPIIDHRVIIKIGGDLVSSYFNSSSELYRYTVSNDQLNLYKKMYNDAFGFGIKCKIDFYYPLSNGIDIFIQPAYTYYIFGEEKKVKFFNGSIGLTFAL